MKRRIICVSFIVTGLLLALSNAGTARSDSNTKFIRDDAAGGDCISIGEWDMATKTCTLTNDLAGSIVIANAGITLNGQGHTVSGDNAGTGVDIGGDPAITNITVKDLVVEHFEVGIALHGSGPLRNNLITHNTVSFNRTGIDISACYGNTIHRNSITSNGNGIHVWYSIDNRFTDNTVANNMTGLALSYKVTFSAFTGNTIANNDYGIQMGDSWGNAFTNNTITGNGYGISMTASRDNTLSNNTISDSRLLGIAAAVSYDNQIYNNNFIDNPAPQAEFIPSTNANTFNLPAPSGGNYWSNYHAPDQGCQDQNRDGFCDAPYVFPGESDNLPWVKAHGWLAVNVDHLIEMKDNACATGGISKKGICTSLGAKLNAAKASIQRSQYSAAGNQLRAFVHQLDAQQGKAVDTPTHDALANEALDLINLLPK